MLAVHKFIIFFAAVGCIMSLIVGLSNGIRFFSLISTAIACAIFASILGFGSYKLLAQHAPEFLSILDETISDMQSFTDDKITDDDYGLTELSPASDTSLADSDSLSDSSMDSALPSVMETSDMNFGKHGLIEQMKLKSDPQVMAEAIRTMLLRDSKEERA